MSLFSFHSPPIIYVNIIARQQDNILMFIDFKHSCGSTTLNLEYKESPRPFPYWLYGSRGLDANAYFFLVAASHWEARPKSEKVKAVLMV